MIILDVATKSLEFKLGGAVSANELPFQASYLDVQAFAPGNQDGVSNGAAAVTVVAAPGGSEERQVKQFTIFNDDTAAADVILQYNNNGTLRQITEISVPANGTLVYTDGEGFRVINSAGQILQQQVDLSGYAIKADAETISGSWIFTAAPRFNDNVKALFGDAGDAAIYYDSADLYIDPQEVGSGDLILVPNGGNVGAGTATPTTLDGGVALEVSNTTGAELVLTRVESGLSDDDFIGGLAFKNTDVSGTPPHYAGIKARADGTNGIMKLLFFAGRVGYELDLPDMTIEGVNGFIGINEDAPGTLLDMASTAPYLTLHNTTHEDGDGGRESRIIFEGEQSGGEITTLALIEASHDGAVDDEKGRLIFSVNDGDDGAAPTELMRLDSTGIGLFATAPVAQQTVTGARDVPEEALADLLTKLAAYGLIVDNTTAS